MSNLYKVELVSSKLSEGMTKEELLARLEELRVKDSLEEFVTQFIEIIDSIDGWKFRYYVLLQAAQHEGDEVTSQHITNRNEIATKLLYVSSDVEYLLSRF